MRFATQLFFILLSLPSLAQDFIEMTIEGDLKELALRDTAAIFDIIKTISALEVAENQKAGYFLDLGQELSGAYQYTFADIALDKCLEEATDTALIADAYFELGLSCMYRDIRIKSLNHFNKALQAYTFLNDSSGMGNALDKIADNHNYIGEHDVARPFYDRALSIFSAIEDTAALTNVLGNIGGMFNEDNINDSSIYYYEKSTQLNELAGNLSNLSDDFAGIAMAYEDMGKQKTAYDFYLKCYQTAYRGGNEEDKAFANQHLGYYHYRAGNLDSAIYYMSITYDLAKQMSYSQLLLNSLDVLHRSYYDVGSYQRAYDAFEEAAVLNDSLLNMENITLINSLRSEYEMERQATVNENLQNEVALRESYLDTQRRLNLLLILGAVLLSVALIFLVILNRNRKRKNRIISRDRDLIHEQSKQLKELDQMKSTFFANIAHDYRAPITLLKGFADLIKINQPNLTEESKEYIAQIHETTERLTSMTEEINQLIQLEQSQYQLKREEIDVNELFGTVGKMYQLGRHNKALSFKYESTVPARTMISADRYALEKIIFNLIGNAFKYNVSGKEVSMQLSKENDYIKMIVCDDGPGILPDKIDKVFERYYRTEKGTETASGLGIGLSLVKDMVELHHGQVSVTSTPGIATCFTVLLPLRNG